MSRPVFAVRIAKRPKSAKGVWGHPPPLKLFNNYRQNPAFWVCFECIWDVQILCQKSVFIFGFKDWKMLIKGKYLNNLKLSVSSFPNFLHHSQDISWLSPSKCSHLYIWSQWGWNVLFLFVASYALLLSRVSTFCLDSSFETPGKNFQIFFLLKK
jgi:hypothetical protein